MKVKFNIFHTESFQGIEETQNISTIIKNEGEREKKQWREGREQWRKRGRAVERRERAVERRERDQ